VFIFDVIYNYAGLLEKGIIFSYKLTGFEITDVDYTSTLLWHMSFVHGL
jgi:hypothetical protein